MEEVNVLGDAEESGELVLDETCSPGTSAVEPTVVRLWMAEVPHGYLYYENSEVARDAELAWGLTGRVIFAEEIVVPAECVIGVSEGGSVDLRWS